MSNRTLTNEDFCAAADELGCSVAAIKAVAYVESAKSGFLPSGRVVILFERHHFSRLTRRRFDLTHPQISNRKPGGYYGGEKEYQRFNQAFKLDPVAAMMSASWGKFQIMGFNHAVCGYKNVHDFVDAMKTGERAQLLAFCEFVKTNRLDDDLQRLDWAGFARGYNGKNYRINRYDIQMREAYARFSREKVNCKEFSRTFHDLQDEEIVLDIPAPTAAPIESANASEILPEQYPSERIPTNTAATEPETFSFSVPTIDQITASANKINQTIAHGRTAFDQIKDCLPGTKATDIAQKVTTGKRTSFLIQLATWAISALTAVFGFVSDNWQLILIGILCAVLIAIGINYAFTQINKLKMQIASDPTKYNVE